MATDELELQGRFQRLRELSRAQPFAKAHERRRLLQQLATTIRFNHRAIEAAINADFGRRHPDETRLSELIGLLRGIDHAASQVGRWMQPSMRWPLWFTHPARARVDYQPLGVVGVISTWNFPILLALGPVVGALAAGNRIVLKPSEFCPRSAEVLAELLPKALGDEWIEVALGGESMAKAMSSLPLDHLVFVGSTHIGRAVMRQAAEHLVPLTLELGGRSPCIVGRDALHPRTAFEILRAKLLNAGQACVAPNHVWLPEDSVEPFQSWCAAAYEKLYPGGIEDPHYTSIGHERHYLRLKSMLEEARSEAATAVLCLDRHGSFNDASRIMAPHLVTRAEPHLEVMRSEIFGPILPILPYKSIESVIETMRAEPRPLTMQLYSRDSKLRRRLLQSTVSGSFSSNSAMVHFGQDDLPIGGVGDSGFGRYHGHDGFLNFSHHRAYYEQIAGQGIDLSLPPYHRFSKWLLSRLARLRETSGDT
jgi:acyl-CoA reductase-like NAD-dependent aldehyde dehydrogenase